MGVLKCFLFFFILQFSFFDFCFAKTTQSVKLAKEFQTWLKKNEKYFLNCDPKLKNNILTLCDGTSIDAREIRKLFSLQPKELLEKFQDNKIRVKVRCQKKSERAELFKEWCEAESPSQYFREVTSLHGQYLPQENTIALNSDANLGSAIHEYLHYLQYKNENKIHGHRYKHDRVRLQKLLTDDLDRLIEESKKMEQAGNKEAAKKLLPQALELADSLQKFGYWQKLIDERNLFRAYILFSKELGVAEEDIALAKKNMNFLCRDPQLENKLPRSQCN